ncbi:integrase [uncultured Lactobacillus sp.]|uniref:integrase n=1 Tax=uncultured Lactobacillus sp. TaxID=153152 RepID=UPI002805D05C|nr:integrase [uncultured Lactobacillus sp.]
MSFPYEKEFRTYCKQKKKLADSTISLAAKSITTFWNYYASNVGADANVNDVRSGDIRNFLDSLETQLHFKSNTVNKYLSHIKMYFVFLSEYGYIITYPLLTLRGNRFDRKQKYIINWMPYLPELIKNKYIHPDTVKMMAAIAAGFKPKEIIVLRTSELLKHLDNEELKKYITSHTNYEKNSDPYLFARKNGEPYASDFNVNQRIAPDRQIIGMPLTTHKLRMSFVYSILSNHQLSDNEILHTLRITLKSLTYYRKNMTLYVETEDFTLDQK